MKTALALLVAAAVVVAGLVAASLLRDGTSSASPLSPTEARAFDPLGDGRESDELAPRAVDGDAATAWRTERYRDPDTLAGKAGVGLIVRFGNESRIDTVTISSPSTGWALVIYAVEGEPGSDLASWGTPLAGGRRIPAGDTSLDLNGVRADAVLVWIVRAGDDGRVEIHEVTAAGG